MIPTTAYCGGLDIWEESLEKNQNAIPKPGILEQWLCGSAHFLKLRDRLDNTVERVHDYDLHW